MKKLIFITSKYPFGLGETFIENEIPISAKTFDKIYVFATEADKGDGIRPVPKNVTVFAANRGEISKKNYIPQLFKCENIKEIFKNCIGDGMFSKVSAVCYFSACVKQSLKNADEFIKLCDIKSDDTVTVYSYWLSTIGMCSIKINEKIEKLKIKTKLVSRCHRYDIYSERASLGYLPFQKYMISHFEKIYPCSNNGSKYLKSKYPKYADRISTSYLAVTDNFLCSLPKKEDIFNIVSCSNVIPVKRVDLIIKALSRITDKKICWTHFGDGELLKDVKVEAENILPENISVSFKGRIPNSEIYEYYNKNNVNLFINVSSSEGLPVSIMEAISFGIPVIATDVGGTNEIVIDGKNGYLLDENFDTLKSAEVINDFIAMPEENYKGYCKNSRKIFEEMFYADKNYSEFCKNNL
ncbi:MAG: glycosyltransferase [Clostridia bacterium]|nr:glycosyltransferase [Clostridia bacterium]